MANRPLFAKLDSAGPTGPREKEPCSWQPGQPLGAQEPTQSQGLTRFETGPLDAWGDSVSLCVRGQAQCESCNGDRGSHWRRPQARPAQSRVMSPSCRRAPGRRPSLGCRPGFQHGLCVRMHPCAGSAPGLTSVTQLATRALGQHRDDGDWHRDWRGAGEDTVTSDGPKAELTPAFLGREREICPPCTWSSLPARPGLTPGSQAEAQGALTWGDQGRADHGATAQ